jgi:hypothetical protein
VKISTRATPYAKVGLTVKDTHNVSKVSGPRKAALYTPNA